MVSSLLTIGFKSLDHLATVTAGSRASSSSRQHPLAAYPRLQDILGKAERNGMLEAERRRLMQRRLAA